MNSKVKDYKKYLLEKCIVGYGIINGAINAAIFWGISAGEPEATYSAPSLLENMALTGFLLGLILTWCVVPLTKMDLKKHSYQKPENEQTYSFSQRLPLKAIPMSFAVGVLALVLACVLSVVFGFVLPMPLSRMSMLILKGVLCAIVGGFSGWCVIGRVTSAYEPASSSMLSAPSEMEASEA